MSDLLSQFETPEVDQEEKEFHEWIELNKETFADRGPDEIAYYAILNGFDKKMIFRVLSCFRDAMRGTSFENRVKLSIWQWDQTWERVKKMREDLQKKARPQELDLLPLWQDLVAFTITGEEIAMPPAAKASRNN